MPAMIALLLVVAALTSAAQTNVPADDATTAFNIVAAIKLKERLRAECIDGRRSICGKIMRIYPEGILVESGYTNLIREPLTKSSWLVPGAAVATRATNLVESKEPGALCVGAVFLTDLPRGKPHQYDYVMIAGYPTGEFTYTSVGTVTKTVRRFSANLDKAVKTNLAAAQNQAGQTHK